MINGHTMHISISSSMCGGGGHGVYIHLKSICTVYPKLVTFGEWDGKGGIQEGKQEPLLFILMLHISKLLEYFYNECMLLL